MATYEYRVIQSAAGAPVSHLNERINAMAEEGWEVIGISGDSTVNVIMRRQKQQAANQPQQQQPGAPQQQA